MCCTLRSCCNFIDVGALCNRPRQQPSGMQVCRSRAAGAGGKAAGSEIGQIQEAGLVLSKAKFAVQYMKWGARDCVGAVGAAAVAAACISPVAGAQHAARLPSRPGGEGGGMRRSRWPPPAAAGRPAAAASSCHPGPRSAACRCRGRGRGPWHRLPRPACDPGSGHPRAARSLPLRTLLQTRTGGRSRGARPAPAAPPPARGCQAAAPASCSA